MKSAILGLGVSGIAVLQYLLALGERPLLLDKQQSAALGLPIYPDKPEFLDQVDRLIVSPGIPEEHPVRKEALRRNIPLTSELDIALHLLRDEPVTLFAITGSCGKTTTTSLVTHILSTLGTRCISYGNIGFPLLNYWKDKPDYAVVEISSFQLGLLTPGEFFDGGVILNIASNHLDYHKTMHEYVLAKMQLAHLMKKNAPFYISKQIKQEWSSFLPRVDCEIACFDQETVASIFSLGYREGGHREFTGDQQNCQAAFALCKKAGVTKEQFARAATSFCKEEHRFEWVRMVNDVSYINDSKATTVLAVMEAVKSIEGRVILIAGGVDKGADFTPWKEALKGKVAHLLLMGQAAPQLASFFSSDFCVEEVGILEKAVAKAFSYAKAGDCVLLSPGCASFDQYKDYKERGNSFKRLVQELGEKI